MHSHTLLPLSPATHFQSSGRIGRKGISSVEYNSLHFEPNSVVPCFSQEVNDLNMGILICFHQCYVGSLSLRGWRLPGNHMS